MLVEEYKRWLAEQQDLEESRLRKLALAGAAGLALSHGADIGTKEQVSHMQQLHKTETNRRLNSAMRSFYVHKEHPDVINNRLMNGGTDPDGKTHPPGWHKYIKLEPHGTKTDDTGRPEHGFTVLTGGKMGPSGYKRNRFSRSGRRLRGTSDRNFPDNPMKDA